MVLKNNHGNRHNQLLTNNGDATKPETGDDTNRYSNNAVILCDRRCGLVRHVRRNPPNFSHLPSPDAERRFNMAVPFCACACFSTAGSALAFAADHIRHSKPLGFQP
jgi:hypothetical protein